MSRLQAIGWAALAAGVVFSGVPHVVGQTQTVFESGRSFAVTGSGLWLPDAQARIDAMLLRGDLDIAGVQEDTMISRRVHERLGQMHQGLPVFGAQVVRQMDGRSTISLYGRLYEDIDVRSTPAISAARAVEIAIAAAGADAAVFGETTLGILPAAGNAYRLVYEMQVRTDWSVRKVFVDAHSREVVLSLNALHSASAIGQGTGVLGSRRKLAVDQLTSTYQAVDTLRPSRAFTLDFRGSLSRLNGFLANGLLFDSDVATDSDNNWTDGPTVDAHVYQGLVYDYYFKRFGRKGMDDRNLTVDSIVHPVARSEASSQSSEFVGTYINNAFYCCSGLLLYGDGDGRIFTYLAGGIDVVAHEWSHGVTEFSSDLIYRDESGALNEAFSDIMAAAIEFFFQPVGTGPEQADWLFGEDVVLTNPGYLRSLINPISAGEPDHYSLRQFIGTDIDDGGVHFNMTIATHAFYLAVAGGRNRVSGINVGGVGFSNLERMERIFYRAFVMLMAPNAQFSDARAATLQAATDLYGFGSNERAQVAQAWTAVGVN
jgi:bacillolysin